MKFILFLIFVFFPFQIAYVNCSVDDAIDYNDFRASNSFQRKFKWFYKARDNVVRRAVADSDYVYFIDVNSYVYAVSAVTGDFIWGKNLALNEKVNLNAKRIIKKNYDYDGDNVRDDFYSFIRVYKNIIILVLNYAKVYALDRFNGNIVWGPVDILERVYAEPLICNDVLFIVTYDSGMVWILDPITGDKIFRYPIILSTKVIANFAVEYNPLDFRRSFQILDFNKSDFKKMFFDFQIYVITGNRLIQIRVSVDQQYYFRIKDFIFSDFSLVKNYFTSAPVIYFFKNDFKLLGLLFVVIDNILYAFNLIENRIEWRSIVDKMDLLDFQKSYFSPFVFQGVVFYLNKAYDLFSGRTKWHLWLGFDFITFFYTKNNIFVYGNYFKNNSNLNGLIAIIDSFGVAIKYGFDVNNIFITLLSFYNNSLYIFDDRGGLYSYY